MSVSPRFFGKIEQEKVVIGKLVRRKMDEWISSLNGKNVEIVIKKQTLTRSIQANNYLWGVVYPIISDDTGHSTMELHQTFKYMYLRKEINLKGKMIPSIDSTTRLSTLEFGQFLDKVIQWASENDIKIPLPDTVQV